jgi:hypothetical protein
MSVLRVVVMVAVAVAAWAAPAAAQSKAYRILAATRTSTMQSELQAAGRDGFRFVAVMGGETAAGNEVVVLMEQSPDSAASYEYLLLAANRTSTLQRELQQAGRDGYRVVGQTVFESAFGGRETAALLERTAAADAPIRYDYRLLATSRTSTLQKELQELADQGYEAIGLTVGETAFGGAELVVITWRPVDEASPQRPE